MFKYHQGRLCLWHEEFLWHATIVKKNMQPSAKGIHKEKLPKPFSFLIQINDFIVNKIIFIEITPRECAAFIKSKSKRVSSV